jgi:hypothetical protein
MLLCGSPAGAQAEAPKPPKGFAEEGKLSGLVWELAGYLTEDTRIEGRSGWRARRVSTVDGGPKATLAMKFGWMDPWPLEMELYLDDPVGGLVPGHGPVSAGESDGDHASRDGPDGSVGPGRTEAGRGPVGPGGPREPAGAEGRGGAEAAGASGSPGEFPDISDRRPFGGEGLKGAKGRTELEAVLERYARGLRGGARTLAGAWEGIGRGMALSESRALYGVRFGSPELLVVKADPEIWEFAPYFSGEGGDDPQASARSVREWARLIPGAALVVNGGQYYADGTSMGRLARDGADVEPRRHPKWKGFLSSGPAGAKTRPFAVADEELPRSGEEPGAWRNVLQSYMALDRLGRVRVSSSSMLASRTAVGEDVQGRICIVYAPGALSLYDMALLLADLEIFPAVSLDGGFESQMALRRGGGWSFFQGEYSHNAFGNVWVKLYQPPLRLAAALVPARRAGASAASAAPGSEALEGVAPLTGGPESQALADGKVGPAPDAPQGKAPEGGAPKGAGEQPTR